MEKIIDLIKETILELDKLNKLIKSFENSNNNSNRIQICLTDIKNAIEHGNYYINNPLLYNANNFRFHFNIIQLIDSIKYNNFSNNLSKKDEIEKNKICSELIQKTEEIIKINNQYLS